MGIKKFMPSFTQSVQVIVIMVVAGMLGIVGKASGFLSGITGKFR